MLFTQQKGPVDKCGHQNNVMCGLLDPESRSSHVRGVIDRFDRWREPVTVWHEWTGHLVWHTDATGEKQKVPWCHFYLISTIEFESWVVFCFSLGFLLANIIFFYLFAIDIFYSLREKIKDKGLFILICFSRNKMISSLFQLCLF